MRPMRRTDGLIESPVASIFNMVRSYNGPKRLLDLTQGAPSYGPPPEVIEHIRSVTSSEDGARYTDRPGLPLLRRLVAEDINETYGGSITPSNVLITAGCNQAFCVAAAALADTGDEIILPVPYYFNHQMWLQINHIVPQHVMVNDQFVSDVDQVSLRVNSKTRAVVLVTPGNPTGRTIPSESLNDFANIAKRNGLMLIIDETYRHFGRVDGRPHELFSRTDWQEWAVFLYSFSKEFAIPGYRVGAAVGHPDLVREMMKIMDCVAICAPRVGQEAAIAGLTRCKDWRREKAVEMYGRQSAFERLLAQRPGHFALTSAGALFGWVRHPFMGQSATDVAHRLVTEQGIVTLPGTIFSTEGEGYLRMSFSGLALTDFGEVGKRLSTFGETKQSKN